MVDLQNDGQPVRMARDDHYAKVSPAHAGLEGWHDGGNIGGTVNGLGDTLRRARRTQGGDLLSNAEATGIPIAHLRAMEEERLDSLPRGEAADLVRRYADHLSLDGQLLGDMVRAEIPTDPDADTQPIPVVAAPARRDATLLWLGAGAAVGLGALVVFGGGLGSGERRPDGPRTARVPAARPSSTRPAPAATPEQAPQTLRPQPSTRPPIDLRLGARGGKTVWMEVRVDDVSGESLFAGIVGGGVTRRFTSRRPLWLGVAWAPNAAITLNGEQIDPEGGTESYLVTAKGISRLTTE